MDRESRPKDPVERAFSAFTQAWFAGENPDKEAFCAAHPAEGQALRKEIEDFLYVVEGLQEIDRAHEEVHSSTPNREEGLGTNRALTDFRILRELGRGGMGTVFEAEQISLHRRVALKILPSHLSLSDEAVKKFRREAEAGGRQHHPGMVSVYAVGEERGIHYIAQELVEGGRTLAHRLDELREEKTFPRGYFRGAARCMADVAEALG